MTPDLENRPDSMYTVNYPSILCRDPLLNGCSLSQMTVAVLHVSDQFVRTHITLESIYIKLRDVILSESNFMFYSCPMLPVEYDTVYQINKSTRLSWVSNPYFGVLNRDHSAGQFT